MGKSYVKVNINREVASIINLVGLVKNEDGSWNNNANRAIYFSPFFQIYKNGKFTKISAFLTTFGLHTCLFLEKNKKNVILKYHQKIHKIDLYSSSNNNKVLEHNFSDNKIYISTNQIGNVTFIINDNVMEPLTIFVENGYQYDRATSTFDSSICSNLGDVIVHENETILFKSGSYIVNTITFKGDNSSLIFEKGTIIKANKPNDEIEKYLEIDWANEKRYRPFITNEGASKNITISGHALFDLSDLPFHARDAFFLHDIDGLKLEGITTINPCCWCYFIYRCKNVLVEDSRVFGYRQNSDAFIIGDCQDAIIKNCYARSGDDLFEVKTLESGNPKFSCKNITFEDCFAWPDKTRGIGIIYETKQSIEKVYYNNIIVFGADAHWQDELGSIIILSGMGNERTVIKDIFFKNINIYKNNFYPINVTNESDAIIENVFFENIYYDNDFPVRINNKTSKNKIKNISFKNISNKQHKILDKNNFIISNNGKNIIKLNQEEIAYEK